MASGPIPRPRPMPVEKRESMLRASILDTALELGVGTSSTVAHWIFNPVDEAEEDIIDASGWTTHRRPHGHPNEGTLRRRRRGPRLAVPQKKGKSGVLTSPHVAFLVFRAFEASATVWARV